MPEILYRYVGKAEHTNHPDQNRTIRWLDVKDYSIFVRHLEQCGQTPISEEKWKKLYDGGAIYCGMFENDMMIARACREIISSEQWEIADVRVVGEYRNQGLAFQICRFVLSYILSNRKMPTIRTENTNYAMQKVIQKLGFRATMQVLETQRLLLREWKMEDLDNLHEYAKNPHVGPIAGWKAHENIEESRLILKSFLEAGDIWAIECKETKKVIGQLRLSNDQNRGRFSENNAAKYISYAIAENDWNKGYMTEAVTRVIQYAFEELKLEVLTAFFYPNNIRSKRVVEKCCFQYETTITLPEQNVVHVVWSIWKSDYFNQ